MNDITKLIDQKAREYVNEFEWQDKKPKTKACMDMILYGSAMLETTENGTFYRDIKETVKKSSDEKE